ncbi:hypothetical protein GCM10028833_13020 [Glycomyces tarimensis]
MEGQSLLRGPSGVVVAHPGDESTVGVEGAEAVRETVAHRRVEASHSVLDEVVDDECGHPVGLERERPEAGVDQLGEHLVAEPPEGRIPVRRLAEAEQIGSVLDEVANVLSHGLKRIVETSVETCRKSDIEQVQ